MVGSDVSFPFESWVYGFFGGKNQSLHFLGIFFWCVINFHVIFSFQVSEVSFPNLFSFQSLNLRQIPLFLPPLICTLPPLGEPSRKKPAAPLIPTFLHRQHQQAHAFGITIYKGLIQIRLVFNTFASVVASTGKDSEKSTLPA